MVLAKPKLRDRFDRPIEAGDGIFVAAFVFTADRVGKKVEDERLGRTNRFPTGAQMLEVGLPVLFRGDDRPGLRKTAFKSLMDL